MNNSSTQRKLIGIVGRQGSGKDIVANYIAEKYFFIHVSLSDIIREYLVQENLGKETRPLMHKSGNTLRTLYGANYLAKKTLEKYPDDNLVISSIRNPQELTLLKKYGIYLIEVIADSKLRYTRLQARKRDGDQTSYEEFQAQENKELTSDKEHEQQLEAIFKQTDRTISNNGSIEDLYQEVDKMMKDQGYSNN